MGVVHEMSVLVTGARGFIGSNLVVRLNELPGMRVLQFTRENSIDDLTTVVGQSDIIVHLAGENRPADVADFSRVNTDLTSVLCHAIQKTGRKIPLIFASSTQAELNNPYGKSKLAAEQVVENFTNETSNPTVIYRLPGVFGKWCKPNYNSVVATYCYNIARNLPIQINDAATNLRLVYVDDVVEAFLRTLITSKQGLAWGEVGPEYFVTLGDLNYQICSFKNCRTSLVSERVGVGLTRALYSTYVSYLPSDQFVYDLPSYGDERGVFVEMLKTPDCGQFSFFTVRPGVTRGSHYHHTKSEKFLVVSGVAKMRFRQLLTGETCELIVTGEKPQVVDTIPGWVHDITNVGDSEAVIMLWANEVFDPQRQDSVPCGV